MIGTATVIRRADAGRLGRSLDEKMCWRKIINRLVDYLQAYVGPDDLRYRRLWISCDPNPATVPGDAVSAVRAPGRAGAIGGSASCARGPAARRARLLQTYRKKSKLALPPPLLSPRENLQRRAPEYGAANGEEAIVDGKSGGDTAAVG